MPATTGGLNTTQESLFYVGAGKEAAWGTAVAPTWFWRWLDGTDANPEAKFAEEREGDGSPHISLVYKTQQYWMIKIVEYLRPITAGYALQALLGSGSDSFAAGTSTTLSAAVVAGATSFQSAASLGNAGTGYVNFTPGYASAVYEVLNVNLASRTGVGPYTYNLVAGQTFANAHANGDTVSLGQVHTLTRQSGQYDAYAIELGFGASAYGVARAIRVRDCVCVELKLTSEANKPVKLEHTWYGAPGALQAALSAVTLEGTSVKGAAGGPLSHDEAQTTWSLDGSTAGTTNAATVRRLELTLKNSTSPEELQSEGLYSPYYMPGNFDVTARVDVFFQNYQQYYETYYGATSPATAATDSYLTGFGSLGCTWAPANIAGATDGLNSLALSLPNVAYTAAKLTPKLSRKPLVQAIQMRAVKSVAQPAPATFTLTNSWPNQY